MNTTDRLDAILDSWRAWDAGLSVRPEPLARLTNGLANQCWLVKSEMQQFVIRLGSELVSELDCSWEQELRATHAASHIGVGPTMLYYRPDSRCMVLRWAGNAANAAELGTEQRLRQLAETLHRLHHSQATLVTPGYHKTLLHYRDLIRARNDQASLNEEMLDFARYLDESCLQPVFCHHDLSLGNILTQGANLYLIDWEYARMAHPLFDLATLVNELDLDEAQSEFLLEHYGAPRRYIEELPRVTSFIRWFAALWEETFAALQSSA